MQAGMTRAVIKGAYLECIFRAYNAREPTNNTLFTNTPNTKTPMERIARVGLAQGSVK